MGEFPTLPLHPEPLRLTRIRPKQIFHGMRMPPGLNLLYDAAAIEETNVNLANWVSSFEG